MAHLLLIAVGAAVFILLRIIRRLYFHPLSGIPGPRLAAATHLYDLYYDVVCHGRLLFQIEKMHQQYGPIVRISPGEVHVSDPAFYDEIYASSGRKRDKDPSFVASLASPGSTAATVGHEHHRYRRGILSDLLSKRALVGFSATVDERVQRLMRRLDQARARRTVVCLDHVFNALASDVVTTLLCGRHWGFLDDDKLLARVRRSIDAVVAWGHITRLIPLLLLVPRVLPERFTSLLVPAGSTLMETLMDCAKEHELPSGKGNVMTALAHCSIPPEERSLDRLQDEAHVLFVAATETTSHVLTMAAYYLARDTAIRDRLRDELRLAMPAPISTATWSQLRKLPYLTAVVNESLRLSNVSIRRLPRVAPTETLTYKQYSIPLGTTMSSSTYLIHRNASVFPDPHTFDPERWVKARQEGRNLQRYLVAFTRGSRACIGMDLAYMELFLTIAHFVRRFDVRLHDTEPEDVRAVGELFVGTTRRGPLRVYATITKADD